MLTVNLQRIYYFLFFSGAYSFLVFWITVSYYFNEKGFLIGGILGYVFVLLFHKAIINISKTNPMPEFRNKQVKIFFISLIIFCAIGVLGVIFLKEIMINKLNLPRNTFQNVGWALEALSLAVSFLISFINKDTKKNI